MKYNVALARFPGDGWECSPCVDWLVRTTRQMREDERVGELIPLRYTTTPIPMARNKAVLDARAKGAHYLLFVDSDMAPDFYAPQAPFFWPVAWNFLMDRRKREEDLSGGDHGVAKAPPGTARGIITPDNRWPPATVAAPYCGPPPEELVYAFHWANLESHNPNPDWKLAMIPREMAAICAGIQEVAAMPTGLILYDMRVFDILPPAWFAYEYRDKTESEKVTTEDVYQTRNASLLGMPQFVAWDCWAAHVKPKVVGKPVIVTRDRVHQSLRDAVLRGVDSDQKLHILRERVAVEEITPTDTPGTEGSVDLPSAFPEWKPSDYWPDPHKESETAP